MNLFSFLTSLIVSITCVFMAFEGLSEPTLTRHFGFVFEENSDKGNHVIIVTSSVSDICRLQTADCRLQTADYRLRTVDLRP